jgi:hypothetical protein
MENKIKQELIKAPMPKQRCQAFRVKTKYNRVRESKGGRDDRSSFL